MKKTILSTLIICLSLFFYSCGNPGDAKLKKPESPGNPTSAKNDTLGNEPYCSIVINGKDYNIPVDSITTAYTFSDSSLGITFKGVNGGRLVLTIPNIFKCPCSIPTGYSSVRFKIAGSDEYSTQPTIELYNYPIAGVSFNNLNDGQHKRDVTENAAEIMSFRKTNENTDTKWAEYLVKGKIHTTVLKNVYESAAGDKNRDYEISSGFVIQAKIYF